MGCVKFDPASFHSIYLYSVLCNLFSVLCNLFSLLVQQEYARNLG